MLTRPSSTSLDSRLPTWLRAGGLEAGKKRLADPNQRDRVVKEMKEELKNRGFKDYSYAVVASYDTDSSFNGKSIAEITKQVRGRAMSRPDSTNHRDVRSRWRRAWLFKHERGNIGNIMREPSR